VVVVWWAQRTAAASTPLDMPVTESSVPSPSSSAAAPTCRRAAVMRVL
jgi:hypothetical protein